mgnify:CR=1 FL=1
MAEYPEVPAIGTQMSRLAAESPQTPAVSHGDRTLSRGELEDLTLQALEDARDITLPRNSRLASVSFTSPQPELAARIANTLAAEFIQANLQRMITMAGDVSRLRPHVKTHKLPQIIALKNAALSLVCSPSPLIAHSRKFKPTKTRSRRCSPTSSAMRSSSRKQALSA